MVNVVLVKAYRSSITLFIPWWQGPFISINCSALNDNLLDSELFGHEAGAFTGAKNRHQDVLSVRWRSLFLDG
nr:sigma 54-interacting transcriptional regulator [Proteus mirabilis]